MASAAACLDSRTWSQAAAVAAATSPANCYQNYTGYYSNMDYLGPAVQQQIVRIVICPLCILDTCDQPDILMFDYFLARQCNGIELDEARRELVL